MNLCSHGHEEICFEGRKCPFCDIIADKDREISDLQDDVNRLEGEVSRLENDLEDLKDQ